MSEIDVGELQMPFYKALGFSSPKNMSKLFSFLTNTAPNPKQSLSLSVQGTV